MMKNSTIENTIKRTTESKSNQHFTNEKSSAKKIYDLKAARGKIFFFTAAIFSIAFILMITLINTILHLNLELTDFFDVAWLTATCIIGFIPWLFFHLVDKYRMTTP